jgi:hypothetical protein
MLARVLAPREGLVPCERSVFEQRLPATEIAERLRVSAKSVCSPTN